MIITGGPGKSSSLGKTQVLAVSVSASNSRVRGGQLDHPVKFKALHEHLLIAPVVALHAQPKRSKASRGLNHPTTCCIIRAYVRLSACVRVHACVEWGGGGEVGGWRAGI